MAMFKNTNISFESKNGDTIIGAEAYFQGTLTAKGSLRVDGRIDGSIVDAKIVTIGKTGKVKGDVSCEICYLCGEVRGNVTALDHIEVLSGAHIEGDIRAQRVMIEDGASFNGNCSMGKPDKNTPQHEGKNTKSEAKQQ
ncbi:MAG: polymer-forming cytoskeletal protein [Elusimicrobia bacterium]|nr:polymer-forming cytoskeletal protein [Elusimicrobiota bacterium]